MKKHIIFCCLICSQIGFAQKTKFYAGLNFSPGASYRVLSKNYPSDIFKEAWDGIVKDRNQYEIPIFGFALGLNAGYQIRDWVAAEVGIQYSQKGFQTKWRDYNLPQQNQPPVFPRISAKVSTTFHYIDIPLKIVFTPGKGKMRFCGTVGTDLNFYVAEIEKSTVKEEGAKIPINNRTYKSKVPYNTFNISPLLGLGLIYNPTPRIGLKIEPMMRFQALKIIDAPVTARLWDVGINLGLIYKI